MDITKIKSGTSEKLNVLILATKDSKYFYHYDKNADAYFLEKVLRQKFPFCYGVAPRTHSGDAGYLDVVLLTTDPLEIGTIVVSRTIGMIRFKNDLPDDVLVAVAVTDKNLATLNDISNIKKKDMVKIEDFLEDFKDKRVERIFNSIHAKRTVKHAIDLYNQEFG